jgi:hypothetical protein
MTSAAPTATKAFGSVKFEDWPPIDRDLMQAAMAPKIFLRPGGPASG